MSEHYDFDELPQWAQDEVIYLRAKIDAQHIQISDLQREVESYKAALERIITVDADCYGDCYGFAQCQEIAQEALNETADTSPS